VTLTPAEAAWISAHPVVRVGVAVEDPPYYFATGQGRYEGFVVDLMERLAQRAGLKMEYQRFERFGDVLQAMRAGAVDVTPFTSESPARAEYLHFVRPLFSTQLVVVADRRLGDITGDSGFGSYRVAVERDSTAAELMRERYPQARLQEYEQVERAVLAVASGGADLFVGFRQVAVYFMEKNLTANLALRGAIPSPGTALGPAVRKGLPELASVLTKAIDELSTEEIADIALRWLPRTLFAERVGAPLALSAEQRAWVQRHGAVRVGYDEGFAPIAFKNRAGGFDGLAADLTRALAAKAGLIIAYEQGGSFADAYRSALKGDIDIVVAAARNVERLQEFDFVGPFLRVPTVVVSSATSVVDVALDTPGPLRLALLREHFLLPRLRSRYPNFRLLEFDSQAEVLQAVREGRADLAIGNMKVVNQLIEARHLGALHTVGTVPLGDSELYFAVRNTKPELARVLRAGLDTLQSQERADIENRWLRVDWTEGVSWPKVAGIAAAVLALAAGVVAVFWRSNRRLREAQAMLRAAHESARQQVAARASFTAYLAHELRGTLGGLAGGLGLMRERPVAIERNEPLLGALHTSAKGLLDLCERTLDFERMLAGGVDLQPRVERVASVIETALAPWRLQAELKGLRLEQRLGFDSRLQASLDAVRLTQVLQNLAGNAVKFTRAGGVVVEVTLAGALAGGDRGSQRNEGHAGAGRSLCVAVQDTGPGIAQDEQAQLFQAFVQGQQGRQARGGAGLGLSICAQIVRAMGGEIRLAESSTAGSRFVFSVPLEPLPLVEIPGPASAIV
jgi:signal transduction histidine kinase